MNNVYQILVDFVTENGLTQQEADLAIKSCAREMAKNSIKVYTASGVIAYFMNATPASAMSYATYAALVGGGGTLIASPQCREVREALLIWKRGDFSKLTH